MNFVFFDTECANCLGGEGKICSFGYVKTDMQFNVIKKKDILINPDAKFLLGNAKTGKGISLAYPLFKFRDSKKFPFYYAEIKKILEDKNNIIFGFSVDQDIRYLIYTCKRYALKELSYNAFDIQLFDKCICQGKNTHGLDYLIKKYNLKSLTYHRSDDDAYMSMEIFKRLCEEINLNPCDAVKEYSKCFIDNKKVAKDFEERKKKIIEKQLIEKMFDEFLTPMAINDITNYDEFFVNKKIVFERKLFNENKDEMMLLKEKIYKKGGMIVKNFEDADYIIIKYNSRYELKENQKYILYKNFVKRF